MAIRDPNTSETEIVLANYTHLYLATKPVAFQIESKTSKYYVNLAFYIRITGLYGGETPEP